MLKGEIKQWWLARRLGVDRKTITRWLSGKTQRISHDNLRRLAGELSCREEDLIVQDSLEALGTREDRWKAARQLQHSNLTEMVGPSYSWELAESVIRSTLDPAMPPDLQAALYMQLASCGIYTHKHDLVRSSAEIALRKATEAEDWTMAHRAETMLGNEALMIGELDRAVEKYSIALARRELFVSNAKLAATLSNMAMALTLKAEYRKALSLFEEAVQVWAEADPVISMSTAWYIKARLHVELMMVPEAQVAISRCREICTRIGFQKNADLCIALDAELASIAGRHDEAVSLARQAAETFTATPNVSPESHESIIRVLRRAGLTDESHSLLNELMKHNIDDKYSIARLHLENARHLMLAEDTEAAQLQLNQANEQFAAIGAPLRISQDLPGESYVEFSG